MAILACFKCFICFQTYVTNILSRCFKSRSCVAGQCPPSATGALSWFTWRRLRPADTSTAHIHKQGRWTLGVVLPCRREMGVGARFCRVVHGMGVGRGSGLWRWMGTGRSAWDAMRARGVGAMSGRGPRAGCQGASLTHKLILYLIKPT